MRAIEQGRYLARAANTGISGFVDPYGRVVQKTALFEQAVLVAGRAVLDEAHALHVASATSSPGCRWRSTAAALLASRRC